MESSDIRIKIRDFVCTNFYVEGALADDASLLEAGVIDSTGVLEIVAFLERTFGITIADDELSAENLDSIVALWRFVAAKTSRHS
jgi:acyl carrier protein